MGRRRVQSGVHEKTSGIGSCLVAGANETEARRLVSALHVLGAAKVVWSRTAGDARVVLGAHQDLLLIESALEGGLELIEAARAMSDPPFIVALGHEADLAPAELIRQGADAWQDEPWSLGALSAVLESLEPSTGVPGREAE